MTTINYLFARPFHNDAQRFEYGACRTLFNKFLWFSYF